MLAPALALLAIAAQQPQEFAVELYVGDPILPVANTTFRPGEVVRLWIETTADAYVTVLDVTPQSDIRLVYPYRVDQAIPRFAAGEIHSLSVDPVFLHWVAPRVRAGSWGPGYLVAIASRRPIQLRPRLERLGLLARWDTRYYSVRTGFVSQGAILDLLDAEFTGEDITAVVVPYDVVAPVTQLAVRSRALCPLSFASGIWPADPALLTHDAYCLLQRERRRASETETPVDDRPRGDTTVTRDEPVDPRRKDTVVVGRERLRPDVERERFVEELATWDRGVAERLRHVIRPPAPPEQQDPIEVIRRFRPELAERLTEGARGQEYQRRLVMERLAAQAERRRGRWSRLSGSWSPASSSSGFFSWDGMRSGGSSGGRADRWTGVGSGGASPSFPTPATPATTPSTRLTPRADLRGNRQLKPQKH